MENIVIVAIAAGVLLLGLIVFQFILSRRAQLRFHALREELVRLESSQSGREEMLQSLREQLELAEQRRSVAENTAQEAERLKAVALKELEHEKQRNADKQLLIEEFKTAARASVMASGQELSSKLLEDHKREAAEVKESFRKDKQEENKDIREFIAKLREQVAQSDQLSKDAKRQSDILWNTFTSPSSTGQLAEVGLENLLKNMGLKANSDFIMQSTVSAGEGAGLRPDCVIRLPNGRVVIIDCKASKHVRAIAEYQGSAEEEAFQQKFLATMREHVKALARKDYANAIHSENFVTKKDVVASQITNIMYIPSTSAIELLCKLDPELEDRLQKLGIIMVSPSSLHGLLAVVSKEITDERKLENQERILQEVEMLLTALAGTFGHLQKVGNSLKTLTTSFSSISGSFNRQVAPKLRRLEAFGLKPQGSSKLPAQLESYELRSLSDTIELESEAPPSLEDFRNQKESA